MSDSLRPHGLHHARLPCSSISPRVCSNTVICSLVLCDLLILTSSSCWVFCCVCLCVCFNLFSVLCHHNIIIISWIVSHWFFYASSGNSSYVMILAPGIFIMCKKSWVTWEYVPWRNSLTFAFVRGLDK